MLKNPIRLSATLLANEPKKPWHEKKQRGWYWDVLKGKRVLQRSTNFMVRKFSYKNY